MTGTIPVIDLEPLARDRASTDAVIGELDAACREHGFFTVVGHGIDRDLLDRLVDQARTFFALHDEEKAAISMRDAGLVWRGWFPVGGELTSGVPDHKEGIYFGEELPPGDPRVQAGLPLHGPNRFPAHPAGMRDTVLEVMERMTNLGHRLMSALALGLGLDPGWFERELLADPVVLFRIFHYPALPDPRREQWGVAEHTDYGLLTMLVQDPTGGLQVHTGTGWIDVPPVGGALVCNLGDMLDRMTGGRYRATPHRVLAPAQGDRIACPFFFDPSWDAAVRPLPLGPLDDGTPPPARRRWDDTDLATLSGTYGSYLLAKVARVFPELAAADPVHFGGPVGERP